MHYGYFDTTRKGSHSGFLTPTVVGVRRPLPSEIYAQSDPLPFEKRRLLQISAYSISIVRDMEKSSIMTNMKLITGFPTSYRWNAYVIPNSPQRVAQKLSFVFKAKFYFNRIKSAPKFLFVKTFSGKVDHGLSMQVPYYMQLSTTISIFNGS